jgi:hypothetical protein
LAAAIIGSAIVIAAGLVAGALILKSRDGVATKGQSTCQAWTQTRLILRAIPALPQGWTWNTPNIDNYIKMQDGPVREALDLFEPQIAAEPVDVAKAASQYVSVLREQMRSLSDHTYVPADGAAVDTALGNLNQLCGIQVDGQPT